MHSDTAALAFNHSYRKIACLAAHCVGAHPYGAVHTLSLARPTSLHYATIGFADGAPLHYVALKAYLLAVAPLSAVGHRHAHDILTALTPSTTEPNYFVRKRL